MATMSFIKQVSEKLSEDIIVIGMSIYSKIGCIDSFVKLVPNGIADGARMQGFLWKIQ